MSPVTNIGQRSCCSSLLVYTVPCTVSRPQISHLQCSVSYVTQAGIFLLTRYVTFRRRRQAYCKRTACCISLCNVAVAAAYRAYSVSAVTSGAV